MSLRSGKDVYGRNMIRRCILSLWDASDGRDILTHGSYLVNLANPDNDKRAKAYDCFVDELKRCEQLGIERHNFQYPLLVK
jgi:endonuclease IV